MNLFYNVVVCITSWLLPIVALFNKKIKLFVRGRKESFSKISGLKNAKTIWFHVASLGEFEQARPIIEEIRNTHSEYKILVTFFSPSGYEIRKNYNLADVVCYLPLDSKSNVREFVKEVNPVMVLFIKYEFWPNLLNELKKKEIKTILVSGILRKNQIFFKYYGGFMRRSLQAFHHFFVQDLTSKELLNSINFSSVTVSGDTRFDRVSKLLSQENTPDFISDFKNNQYTVVAGSTWKEDEELLVNYIINKASAKEKFIIAPHNINKDAILKLQEALHNKAILFSEKEGKKLSEYKVLILDTIGILTKIYPAADAAYVGGGLRTGLHNILEPATFGIPIVIGNQYKKFKEAIDLVALKGCISISNQKEFSSIFIKLHADENYRKTVGEKNKQYIQQNLGATRLIMNYLKITL
jgi:3-deoxy-D-manno-octulosonic-acid transferase